MSKITSPTLTGQCISEFLVLPYWSSLAWAVLLLRVLQAHN